MAAGDLIVHGDNELVQQPRVETYTPEDGTSIEDTYLGNPAKVDAMVTALKVDTVPPARIDVQRGPVSMVKAYYPYESAEGRLELVPEVFEKRLASFPLWSADLACASGVEKVDKAIASGTSRETDWNVVYSATWNLNAYRDLRLLGVDSYYAYTYRMRWTVPSSEDIITGLNAQGIGFVTDYASVIAFIQGWMTSTPIRWDQPYITSYVQASGIFDAVLIDQWYLFPPRIEKVGRTYFIAAEWLGAEHWSSTLYSGGDGPV
jgi:hypothetical protein